MKRTTTFLIAVFCCLFANAQVKTTSKNDNGEPFVLGRILKMHSTELGEERTLNIYLPDGYNKNDTTRYPVIYLLDGGVGEDFIHVVGLVQFNNFPWVNRVPKSIVVGIANVDRKRDFTYPTAVKDDLKRYPTAGKSVKFIAFLKKELQPYIEQRYKTNTSKMLIGESLAGLLTTEVLMKEPTLFSKYIIISPSIWWDNGSLLQINSAILNADFRTPTQIYIGVGKEGLTPGDNPRVMEVDANLLAEKIRAAKSKSVTVCFDYLPQEDHATITHQAIFNAFRLLYPVK